MTSTYDMEKKRQNAKPPAQASIDNSHSAVELESENDNAPSDQEISNLPEKVVAEEPDLNDEAQYPHGLKLLIIVVALGMSIFLVALDMVSLTISQLEVKLFFKVSLSSNVKIK